MSFQPIFKIILLSYTLFLMSCSGSSSSSGSSGSTTDGGGTTDSGESIIMAASSSASSSTRSSSHSDTTYFTPFRFSTILQDSYTPTNLTSTTSISTRSRYMIKSSGGNYLAIGSSGAASANSTLSTYNDTVAKIFEAIADSNNSNYFRFDSELHGLFSLDIDTSGNVYFANNWGTASTPTSRGYVVFYYDPTTRYIQAKSRYSYNLSTYTHSSTADSSFSFANYYLRESGGSLSVVASSSSATAFSLYSSPINVSMPTNFNPDSIAYQTNSRVSIANYVSNTTSSVEGTSGRVYQNMSSSYTSQISAVGDNSTTETAAISMLNTIETTLTNEGASLRYPKALYLAFRKGALKTTLASDGIANGTLGMNTVPYVYFTNEADSSGVHHPFMVMASYSISDKPNRLVDVNRPPGDGTTGGYATQSVTRDATLQLYLVKIPLKNYGEISSLTENTMPATLNSDAGSAVSDTVYNYASTSGSGVAVDGVVIYPSLNNTLSTAQSQAEITSGGIHVGQGMGLHYHADGHTARSNDFNLYNINDYIGQNHPPLIGFAFDGVALFGTYESSYPSMEGYDVSLDSYGGHSHGTLGYHYHAHQVSKTTNNNVTYNLHVLLKGAWKGKINSIPEFWDTSRDEPAYSLSQRHKYVGKP